MAELANCIRCDDVYVKSTRNICPECYRIEEAAFQTVYKFLNIRKNRQATLLEIIPKTDVGEELILKFIKEKRLHISDFPNLTYPCKKCESPIIEGKLCLECISEIQQDLAYFEDVNEKKLQIQKKEREKNVYYSIDKNKNI